MQTPAHSGAYGPGRQGSSRFPAVGGVGAGACSGPRVSARPPTPQPGPPPRSQARLRASPRLAPTPSQADLRASPRLAPTPQPGPPPRSQTRLRASPHPRSQGGEGGESQYFRKGGESQYFRERPRTASWVYFHAAKDPAVVYFLKPIGMQISLFMFK